MWPLTRISDLADLMRLYFSMMSNYVQRYIFFGLNKVLIQTCSVNCNAVTTQIMQNELAAHPESGTRFQAPVYNSHQCTCQHVERYQAEHACCAAQCHQPGLAKNIQPEPAALPSDFLRLEDSQFSNR